MLYFAVATNRANIIQHVNFASRELPATLQLHKSYACRPITSLFVNKDN